MGSSGLVKSLLLASAAAWSARADILPPDSHLVPRTVTLVNTGDYPGLVFVALEFYPGNPGAPVAATRMGPDIEAKVSGYKLDFMRIYAAKASDWPALKDPLGLGTAGTPSLEWKTRLTLVPGDLDANAEYVPNSSSLKLETNEYKLEGMAPDKVSFYASLRTYVDGSKKEIPASLSTMRPPGKAEQGGDLAAKGRSLIWIPRHNGVAAIRIFGIGGRRVWSVRSVGASGQVKIVALPSLAKGRYFVSAASRSWSQSAWLDLGER